MQESAPDVRDDHVGWFWGADDVGGAAGLPWVLRHLRLPGGGGLLVTCPSAAPPEHQDMGAADALDAARQGTGRRPQQLDLKEESGD